MAAHTSGVASRIVENRSEQRQNRSHQILLPAAGCPLARRPQESEPVDRPAEHRFGGDEEDDERLENQHDVFGDELRERIDRHAAALQHREEQRRGDDTERMVAPQQRDRDAREAVVVGEAVVIPVPVAEHLVDADHSRQRAGDRHRQHDLFANGDAAVFGRCRVLSGRANLVPPLRLPQEDVDEPARDERKEKARR